MDWRWIAFTETALDDSSRWWTTPDERSEAVQSCVNRLVNLGSNLAVAGAMQAMFNLGSTHMFMSGPWSNPEWAPNVSNRPAPGCGEP